MVELAQALNADGLAASGGGFIRKVAEIKPRHEENDMHAILKDHGLSLPIPVQPIMDKNDLKGFPRLKPLDLLSYMAETGHINKLLGGKSPDSARELLGVFWEKYRAAHSDFELFRHSDVDLRDCIPIVAHIDGGRGYKKSEFMVFNWGAIIGGSYDKSARCFKKRRKNHDLNLPLVGHSYTTHYLYAAMPALWHKHNEDAFQALLTSFAEDLRECYDEGVSYRGRVIRLVLLGLKGDLKMQARAGRLNRWHSTARKKPLDPKKASKTTGRCCAWCFAGDPELPFEEIHTELPAWRRHMVQENPEPPWNAGDEGGMLAASLGYQLQPAKFYLPDLFHIYLAGVGQDFVASAVIYVAPLFFPGERGCNALEDNLENLTRSFHAWRKKNKIQAHVVSLTKEKLGYVNATDSYPTGTWSKCADTTSITKYILHICTEHPAECARDSDAMLFNIQRASDAIGRFTQGLYEAGVWVATPLHQSIGFVLRA